MAEYQTEHHCEDCDDVVIVEVPMRRADVERLLGLAEECHAEPTTIAASLLHDVLADDAFYNDPVPQMRGLSIFH